MKPNRQAILCVSRELLESLLPDWQTVAMLRYGSLVKSPADVLDRIDVLARPFHQALKLPVDCQITGISQHYRFNQDQIAFRVTSPDFIETMPWNRLPDVEAVYQPVKEAGIPDWSYFLRWDGLAVAVHRTYGPDGTVLPTPTLNGLPIHKVEGHGISKRTAPYVMISLEDMAEEANKLGGQEGGYCGPGVAELAEEMNKLVGQQEPDPLVMLYRCWNCGVLTSRLLPTEETTAECLDCAKKPLL